LVNIERRIEQSKVYKPEGMTERVRGRVIKAFLPYLSDKFPISGVITTDPTPAICNINPFQFLFLFFFSLFMDPITFFCAHVTKFYPTKQKSMQQLKGKQKVRVDIYGYLELCKLRRIVLFSHSL